MHAIFNFRETISLIAVPLLLLPLPLAIQTEPAVCAYTILIVVGYWVTHAVPLATTALVPTMIMPLFGVVNAKTLCKLYMQETNFLAFSCLLLTIAIEKWNLHRRVALRVLTLVGVTPRRLLTFFMTMTAIISIFISNTATASLIIPFVHGVLITLDDDISRRYNIKLDDKGNIVDIGTVDDIVEESDTRLTDHIQTHARNLVRMNKALRLCVPLAATLSGMASLAGTPTNDALYNYVSKNYGKTKLNYNNWLICTLPLTIILLLFAWIWLIVLFLGFRGLIGGGYNREETEDIKQSMENEYNELGPITFAEVAVTCHGVLLLLLWASREPKIAITWSSLYGAKYWYITDSASAVLIGICLFAFPSQQPVCCQRGTEPQEPVSFPGLLDWPTVHAKMPWGMLLVVGSGYAIAKGIKVSGLDEVIGLWMLDVSGQSPSIVVFVVCLLATMMTQVTSNADTSRIILPQLEALTNHMKVNPLRMMVPSVQCCSYGFLLPVSTSTNAIVYAFGRIDLVDMDCSAAFDTSPAVLSSSCSTL